MLLLLLEWSIILVRLSREFTWSMICRSCTSSTNFFIKLFLLKSFFKTRFEYFSSFVFIFSFYILSLKSFYSSALYLFKLLYWPELLARFADVFRILCRLFIFESLLIALYSADFIILRDLREFLVFLIWKELGSTTFLCNYFILLVPTPEKLPDIDTKSACEFLNLVSKHSVLITLGSSLALD